MDLGTVLGIAIGMIMVTHGNHTRWCRYRAVYQYGLGPDYDPRVLSGR